MFYFSLLFLLSYSFFAQAMQKQLIEIPESAYSSEQLPIDVYMKLESDFSRIKQDYSTRSKEDLYNLYMTATILAVDLRLRDDSEYQKSPLKKAKKLLWKTYKTKFPEAIPAELDEDQSDKEDEFVQPSIDTFEAKIKAVKKRSANTYERSKSATALRGNNDLKITDEEKKIQEVDNNVSVANAHLIALQTELDKELANKENLLEKKSHHEQKIHSIKQINSLLEKTKKANHNYVQYSLNETILTINHTELSIEMKKNRIDEIEKQRKDSTAQKERELTALSAKFQAEIVHLTAQLKDLNEIKGELEAKLNRIDKPRQTLTGSLKDNTQSALEKAASAFWSTLGYTDNPKDKNTQPNEK